MTGAGHELWEDRILEELDGRLPAGARADLERHLAECAECRRARDEYADLLARLGREAVPGDGSDRPGFWEELAAGIERRVSAGDDPGSAEAPLPSRGGDGEDRQATSGVTLIDLGERARFRNGLAGVGGGLLAAGIAVVLLVGLYLTLPRTGPEPQAFTTAVRPATDHLEAETGDDLLALVEQLAADAGEEPVSLAPLREAGDGVAGLVEEESSLDDLTASELEELLATLESRT